MISAGNKQVCIIHFKECLENANSFRSSVQNILERSSKHLGTQLLIQARIMVSKILQLFDIFFLWHKSSYIMSSRMKMLVLRELLKENVDTTNHGATTVKRVDSQHCSRMVSNRTPEWIWAHTSLRQSVPERGHRLDKWTKVKLDTTIGIDASHSIPSILTSPLPQKDDDTGVDGHRSFYNLVDVFPYELELGFHAKQVRVEAQHPWWQKQTSLQQ